MAITIDNKEIQFNGAIEAGDTIAIYVNDVKLTQTEFTVATGNKATIVFGYQEQPL